MLRLVILGCTGSIGQQTLDVIKQYPQRFNVTGISAIGSQVDKLAEIIADFQPEILVIRDAEYASRIQSKLSVSTTRILSGIHHHCDLAAGKLVKADVVVSALSGTAGLEPTFAAIAAGMDLALANKETLVAGGDLVMATARETGSRIFPVDSEHSAISRCLRGLEPGAVNRIILTCSGGPFSGRVDLDLEKITVRDALDHPTWAMGDKITIDSATLMNKGLEVIEARWLFDLEPDQIDVVLHPESIIHSMVETRDGSVMAQMSVPDMRIPILYALNGGRHDRLEVSRLNLSQIGQLTFAEPDLQRFPCLKLAYDALAENGTLPAVLNAANEVAVNAFCRGEISFTAIPGLIRSVMDAHETRPVDGIEAVLAADIWAKQRAREAIQG